MFCQSCGQQIPDGSRFCPNCGYQYSQSQTPAQPAAQQPVYQQPVYQQPVYQQPAKRKKKGCLIAVIVGLAVIAALVIAVALGGGSCSVTTARLTDAAMASKIDASTMQAIVKTKTFEQGVKVIYATALLKNAPDDTKIGAKWYYVTNDEEIATDMVTNTETNQYISFSITLDAGFPAGDYKVELFIDDKQVETLEFQVK
jgi:hypothetical protein